MHHQDRPPLGLGGQRDHHLTVKAARPQQRRVQGLRPVGRGHHHHPGRRVKPIHLRQHLVQGLVPLIIGHQLPTPTLPDGIDLIDEHNRRRPPPRPGQQTPDPGRPHPDKHPHKRAPGDRDERHMGLPRHRPRQQRLARPRRPHHQHPLGADRPRPPIPIRILEEVDHLGPRPLPPPTPSPPPRPPPPSPPPGAPPPPPADTDPDT